MAARDVVREERELRGRGQGDRLAAEVHRRDARDGARARRRRDEERRLAEGRSPACKRHGRAGEGAETESNEEARWRAAARRRRDDHAHAGLVEAVAESTAPDDELRSEGDLRLDGDRRVEAAALGRARLHRVGENQLADRSGRAEGDGAVLHGHARGAQPGHGAVLEARKVGGKGRTRLPEGGFEARLLVGLDWARARGQDDGRAQDCSSHGILFLHQSDGPRLTRLRRLGKGLLALNAWKARASARAARMPQ